MISLMALKYRQNAEQFCSAQSEKRRTESWRIYVRLKKTSEMSFEEIKHFKPKHRRITESHWSNNAKQEEGESVSNFFARLKKLFSTC